MVFDNNFGFIYFPGPRASAYLKVLSELDVVPSTIVLMQNTASTKQEQFTLQYQHLSPLLCDLDDFVKQHKVQLIEVNVTSINALEIEVLLDSLTETSWLFSGGGILKQHLFNNNRKFLHIHPGILPEEKGSTCFYYSLLQKGLVGASAFWLTPELDAGQPLTHAEFTININPSDCTDKMLDYWLDPYIRSYVLRMLLLKQGKPLVNYSKRVSEAPRAYYVIHPILRVIALKKLIASYQPENNVGVFEVACE